MSSAKKRKGGIAKVRSYALSDSDLRELLGDNIAIHNYPELERMESIDDLFDDEGRAILLYPNSGPTSGHWVALIRRPDSIHFFDPYGEAPDHQNDDLPTAYLKTLDVDQPFLTRLFRASGLPVYYNKHQFQVESGDIATCGKHCAVRLFYAPYSLEKYKQIIDSSKMAPDDFVSGVVYSMIKK